MSNLLMHRRRLVGPDGLPIPPDPEPPTGPTQTISFTADNTTDFVNPERGWHSDRVAGSQFAGIRTGGAGTNGQNMALNRFLVRLDDWRNTNTLPTSFFNSYQTIFNQARSAGIKLNLRHVYNYTNGGQDTNAARIILHIEQLSSILNSNADVISNIQMGFAGAFGEWWGSSNGITSGANADSSGRNSIIAAALEHFPQNRMINFRYPENMAEFFGNRVYNNTPVGDRPVPVTAAEAFTGVDKARMGTLNDCFLRNGTDGGTFVNNRWASNWGNGNQVSMAYWQGQSRYVCVDGETCAVSWRGFNNEDGAAAINYMTLYNQDILNRTFNTRVMSGGNDYIPNPPPPPAAQQQYYPGWIQTGHYDEISRRLGYRLRLTTATLPTTRQRGEMVNIQFTMANDGFGKVFNPRPIDLVLVQGGTPLRLRLTPDARRDLPLGGQTRTLSYNVQLPSNMATGTYSMHLALPDPYPSIENDARYAIRLANNSLWNNSTGRNSLNANLTVTA